MGMHCALDAQKHAQEHVKLLIYLFKYKSAMVSEDSSLYQRVKLQNSNVLLSITSNITIHLNTFFYHSIAGILVLEILVPRTQIFTEKYGPLLEKWV